MLISHGDSDVQLDKSLLPKTKEPGIPSRFSSFPQELLAQMVSRCQWDWRPPSCRLKVYHHCDLFVLIYPLPIKQSTKRVHPPQAVNLLAFCIFHPVVRALKLVHLHISKDLVVRAVSATHRYSKLMWFQTSNVGAIE